MSNQHIHSCLFCAEEAVPERCRYFRFDWLIESENEALRYVAQNAPARHILSDEEMRERECRAKCPTINYKKEG